MISMDNMCRIQFYCRFRYLCEDSVSQNADWITSPDLLRSIYYCADCWFLSYRVTARCFIEWDEPHRTQVISLFLTPPLSDLSLPRVTDLKALAAQGTTLLADQKTAGV
jgi:hypothetical protein